MYQFKAKFHFGINDDDDKVVWYLFIVTITGLVQMGVLLADTLKYGILGYFFAAASTKVVLSSFQKGNLARKQFHCLTSNELL